MIIRKRENEKNNGLKVLVLALSAMACSLGVCAAQDGLPDQHKELYQAHKTTYRESHKAAALTRTLESLVEKLARLQQQVEMEKQSWQEEKAGLQQTFELLRKEKTLLEKEIRTMKKNKTTQRAERAQWLEEERRYTKVLENCGPALSRGEADLLKWQKRLPPALLALLKKQFNQLNCRHERAVSQRMQLVLNLYGKIEGFQHRAHLVREVLTIKGGRKKEFDVLYLGLAQGFAVSRDNQQAGLGRPDIGTWTWDWRPELIGKIRQSMDYYRHNKTADFVLLPLRIKKELP